jgi:hypothetical protein
LRLVFFSPWWFLFLVSSTTTSSMQIFDPRLFFVCFPRRAFDFVFVNRLCWRPN